MEEARITRRLWKTPEDVDKHSEVDINLEILPSDR